LCSGHGVGLVAGRDKSMIAHVRAFGSINTVDKLKAEADVFAFSVVGKLAPMTSASAIAE
jgi:hypothetical protein